MENLENKSNATAETPEVAPASVPSGKINPSASTNPDKKTLISIRELKQYFPVRGRRGLFVKANDGVSLEIYEGETLGIVGESGCGKSTLGRTLLQLYDQTGGETIYYGQTMDSIAPAYALEIYRNLEKKCRTTKQELEKVAQLEIEYSTLEKSVGNSTDQEQQKALYAKLNEVNALRKRAVGEYLAIVRLVGGFYVTKNYAEVVPALIEHYKSTLVIRGIQDQLDTLELEMAEKRDEGAEVLKGIQAKMDNIKSTRLAPAEAVCKQKEAALDAIRAKHKGDEEFQKYEAMRDTGIDLARLRYSEMRRLRKDLQLIFQDPFSSLNPRLTVGQIIAEGPITHKYYKRNNSRMQDYSMEVMENCGLAPYMIHRYPHQFSGGQRQRIGIARALAVKPRFVVCDEAVSALDVSIQSQIINLLRDLKEKENLTYMFISHDLSVIKYISDRIAVMYLGNIVELCEAQEMFENPLHPYTEALLSAIPTTDVDKEKEMIILEGDIPSPVRPPKGCKFNTRCRYRTDICFQVFPEWQEPRPGHFVACHSPLVKTASAK
jgi:peptide/nickel transport system ATP-binding protein